MTQIISPAHHGLPWVIGKVKNNFFGGKKFFNFVRWPDFRRSVFSDLFFSQLLPQIFWTTIFFENDFVTINFVSLYFEFIGEFFLVED